MSNVPRTIESDQPNPDAVHSTREAPPTPRRKFGRFDDIFDWEATPLPPVPGLAKGQARGP